jgi:hypothetical protein
LGFDPGVPGSIGIDVIRTIAGTDVLRSDHLEHTRRKLAEGSWI